MNFLGALDEYFPDNTYEGDNSPGGSFYDDFITVLTDEYGHPTGVTFRGAFLKFEEEEDAHVKETLEVYENDAAFKVQGVLLYE